MERLLQKTVQRVDQFERQGVINPVSEWTNAKFKSFKRMNAHLNVHYWIHFMQVYAWRLYSFKQEDKPKAVMKHSTWHSWNSIKVRVIGHCKTPCCLTGGFVIFFAYNLSKYKYYSKKYCAKYFLIHMSLRVYKNKNNWTTYLVRSDCTQTNPLEIKIS